MTLSIAWRRWTNAKAEWSRCVFFGGLSVEETAEVLKVSAETVARDWRLAKAWLLREMSGKADES